MLGHDPPAEPGAPYAANTTHDVTSVLFVNPRSGGGKAARAGLVERARGRGIEVMLVSAERPLAALVEEAVAGGADALGVAGGDGSLAVVAAAASPTASRSSASPPARETTSRSTSASIAATRSARSTRSPTASSAGSTSAEVNGRLFLNNVSIGVYGEAVRQPAYRDAKARTLLATAAQVLGPSAAAAACGSSTTAAACTATPRSSSSRTTPTRWSRRNPRYAAASSTAVGSGSSSSTPAGSAPALGVDRDALEVTASAPVHAGVDGEAVDLPRRSSSRSGRGRSASWSAPRDHEARRRRASAAR